MFALFKPHRPFSEWSVPPRESARDICTAFEEDSEEADFPCQYCERYWSALYYVIGSHACNLVRTF